MTFGEVRMLIIGAYAGLSAGLFDDHCWWGMALTLAMAALQLIAFIDDGDIRTERAW